MPKADDKLNETFFRKVVRDIVREELRDQLDPIARRIEEHVLSGVEELMYKFRNDLATMKDEIITEVRDMREEYEIMKGRHTQILDLENKVEKLEEIHPNGTHPSA